MYITLVSTNRATVSLCKAQDGNWRLRPYVARLDRRLVHGLKYGLRDSPVALIVTSLGLETQGRER
jgi:hypothetical protein